MTSATANDSSSSGVFCVTDRILTSWHRRQADFEHDPALTFRIKTVPETHDDIVRVLRWRNAVPHPSIVFKRDIVLRIGGYHPILYLEDYDLFMRLVAAGARLHAIQRPLIHVRVTHRQRMRRGGWSYAMRDTRFRWFLYRHGHISLFNCCVSTLVYSSFRLAPPFLKQLMYSAVRRARTAHPASSASADSTHGATQPGRIPTAYS